MPKPESPHRSALRKGRVSLPNQAYFITKCALLPVLGKGDCAEIVVQSLLWARDAGWWRILGFAVMPDHYHLAMALGEAKDLSYVMYSIDRFTATQMNKLLGRTGSLWEEGFYDHAIRDRRDFDDILEYIHSNPVAAGLAEDIASWPFSTASPTYEGEIDWEWLGGPSLAPEVMGAVRFDEKAVAPKYR